MFTHIMQRWLVCSVHPSFISSPPASLGSTYLNTQVMPYHCSTCALWALTNQCITCWVGSDSHLSLTCKLSDESVILGVSCCCTRPMFTVRDVDILLFVIKSLTHSCLHKRTGCFLKGRKQEADLLEHCFWLWHCYLVLLK